MEASTRISAASAFNQFETRVEQHLQGAYVGLPQ